MSKISIFTRLNAAAGDRRLAAAHFRLLYVITQNMDRPLSQKMLANCVGMDIRRVRRLIDDLVGFGYLVVNEGRGSGRNNEYTFPRKGVCRPSFEHGKRGSVDPLSDAGKGGQNDTKRGANQHGKGGQIVKKKGVVDAPSIDKDSIDKDSIISSLIPACDQADPSDQLDSLFPKEEVAEIEPARRPRKKTNAEELEKAFEHFWAIYPHRVGKPSARKAFFAAIKNGTPAQTILEGARRYAERIQSAGTEPRFVKNPGGWLRDERWTDAPEEPAARTGSASAIEGIFDALSDRRWRQ